MRKVDLTMLQQLPAYRSFCSDETYFTEHYGNPSSVYAIGREARKAVDEAREKLCVALGAEPQEIIFTPALQNLIIWRFAALRGAAA